VISPAICSEVIDKFSFGFSISDSVLFRGETSGERGAPSIDLLVLVKSGGCFKESLFFLLEIVLNR